MTCPRSPAKMQPEAATSESRPSGLSTPRPSDRSPGSVEAVRGTPRSDSSSSKFADASPRASMATINPFGRSREPSYSSMHQSEPPDPRSPTSFVVVSPGQPTDQRPSAPRRKSSPAAPRPDADAGIGFTRPAEQSSFSASVRKTGGFLKRTFGKSVSFVFLPQLSSAAADTCYAQPRDSLPEHRFTTTCARVAGRLR